MIEKFKHPVFGIISGIANELDFEVYVVGGWVRDLILGRKSKDIDILVVGDGVGLAQKVCTKYGKDKKLKIFKNFGTAQLRIDDWEMEFVGARRESYGHESRKPVVESGTFDEDISRRDFTINALAISLNRNNFGQLIDKFGGVKDIEARTIRTPLDPSLTFSDDPLRMMRAVRFATQLGFDICEESLKAISNNAQRIEIVSTERIIDEFNKIMLSPLPGKGIKILRTTGLLGRFFYELDAMHGISKIKGKSHKDNFYHSLKVLDQISTKTDNLWLRWAALLHDIGKPKTRQFDDNVGWTFHGHEYLGAKMIPHIFTRLRLPLDEKMKYVQKLVLLHLRPIILSHSDVTDSAVRRLLFEAGNDIDDLMTLCEADITSANEDKVASYLGKFALVRKKLQEIEEKDKLRNWQPPINGDEIMNMLGLKPGREIGLIKNAIREAILDGIIANDKNEAVEFMLRKASEMGIQPKDNPTFHNR